MGRQRNKQKNMTYRYNWFFKSLVFIGRQTLCRYLKVRVTGLENLPQNKRFILASNHRSTLDPILILSFTLPYLQCMISPAATRGLFVGPLGWILRKMGSAEIDRTTNRNLGNIRHLLKALKSRPILIFPEGGIVTPPERRIGKTGVAFIADRAQVPVIPLAVVGTQFSLPKGGRWIRRHAIQIHVGKPLTFEPNEADKAHRQFTDRIMEAIYHLEAQEAP